MIYESAQNDISMPKFYFGLIVYLQQNMILYSIKPIKG